MVYVLGDCDDRDDRDDAESHDNADDHEDGNCLNQLLFIGEAWASHAPNIYEIARMLAKSRSSYCSWCFPSTFFFSDTCWSNGQYVPPPRERF